MSLKLEGAEVEIDVVRLDSNSMEEHFRSSAAALCEILQDDSAPDDHDTEDPSKARVIYKGHTCQHCGKLYKSAATLNAHIRLKHPPNNEDVVRCTICNKNYASTLSLRMHVRYMHQFEHRCNVCYRTFPTVSLLGQHGEVCVKCEMACPTCGKIFNSHVSLKGHEKYKHPKELRNHCHVCRRTFNSRRGLSNHMAAIHPTGINCSQCNKAFCSVSVLQNHILDKHSGSGARCSLCRKAFSSQASLTRHLTKVHDIEVVFNGDNFWCAGCHSDYQSVNDLIQHAINFHTKKYDSTE